MTQLQDISRIVQLENSLNEAHRQRALAEVIWLQEKSILESRLRAAEQNAELLETCKFFFSSIESGVLVYNAIPDATPDWPIKMVAFFSGLAKARAAIAYIESSNA